MLRKWFQNFAKPKNNLGGLMALLVMSIEHKKFHRFVAETINVPKNGKILDIGCGGGVFIKEMQKRAPGSVFYGVDVSEQSVKHSKKVNKKSIENGLVNISLGSSSSLNFENGYFDLITACATVYFWKDLLSDFKKVLDLLNDGGRFVVAGGTVEESHTTDYEKVIEGMTYYSETQIKEFMEQAGFVDVQIKIDETNKVSCVIGKKKGETKKIPCGIGGVPETMLIPLWAKAYENRKPDGILKDEFALNILDKLDYDFSKFAKAKLSQLGCCVRTNLIDNALKTFLNENSNAVIVNFGAGLCTRVKRLEQLNFSKWIDIDLPESINLRKQFICENERISFISISIFDFSWMDEIPKDKPIMFIAEGLFMYFKEDEIKPLFKEIAKRFKGSQILFESIPPIAVNKANMHDTLKKMDSKSQFLWSPYNTKDLEQWDSNIKFIEEWNYAYSEKKKWGIFGLIARCPLLKKKFACRITHLKFE